MEVDVGGVITCELLCNSERRVLCDWKAIATNTQLTKVVVRYLRYARVCILCVFMCPIQLVSFPTFTWYIFRSHCHIGKPISTLYLFVPRYIHPVKTSSHFQNRHQSRTVHYAPFGTKYFNGMYLCACKFIESVDFAESHIQRDSKEYVWNCMESWKVNMDIKSLLLWPLMNEHYSISQTSPQSKIYFLHCVFFLVIYEKLITLPITLAIKNQ